MSPIDALMAELEQALASTRKEGARMFREALASISTDALATSWTLRAGAQVFFTMPRAVVLRSFVFNHLYHHRGQMTVHLRLVGARVPGMYGPSADEMPMPS